MTRTDTLSDTLSSARAPTSFGVFKPVGHVMVGLPRQGDVDAPIEALHAAGWPLQTLLHFTPKDGVEELQSLVDGPGPLAGFRCEITLLRRYLDLATHGCPWLLVKVDGPEAAANVAQQARDCHATLPVHYRSPVVEEQL